MKERKIVRSLHLKKDKSNLNKRIKLDKYNLDIATEVSEWEPSPEGHMVACVNAFGFGGSNCHAIVQKNGEVKQPTKTKYKPTVKNIISISAIDAESLQINLEAFSKDLRTDDSDIGDISMTSLLFRDTWPYRALIFGNEKEEILKELAQFKVSEKQKSSVKNNVVFVFCGVGTTWHGMGREFMSNDVFRRKIEKIDEFLQEYVNFRMGDLFADLTSYGDPLINHIAIFCCQVALAEMWIQLGIKPDSIVGQSVGEVASAYISGILPLHDAVKVIVLRSRLLAEHGGGSMAVIKGVNVKEVESICSQYKNVNVAVYSSPVGCTISGNSESVQAVCDFVQNTDIYKSEDLMIRRLNVATAYHSALVEQCSYDIERGLSDLRNTETFKYNTVSSVSGDVATLDDFTSGQYWSKNVRQPVLFYQSIEKATFVDKRNIFIEIGPRQVLKAHLSDILKSPIMYECHPSMNPKRGMDCFLTTMSVLYSSGMDLNWEMFFSERRTPVKIPRTYFNPSRQAIHIGNYYKKRLAGIHKSNENTHLFMRENQKEGIDTFQVVFNEKTAAFAFDHRMSDVIVVPGATYIEVGIFVGSRVLMKKSTGFSISLQLESPVTLQKGTETIIEVDVYKENASTAEYCCQDKAGNIVATGKIFPTNQHPPRKIAMTKIFERCQEKRSSNQTYAALEKLDFKYGPWLSLIKTSWCSKLECMAELHIAEDFMPMIIKTCIHPAILDCMFQCFAHFYQEATGHTMPRGGKQITVLDTVDREDSKLYVYVKMIRTSYREKHFNLFLLRASGEVICEMIDVYTQTVSLKEKEKYVYEVGKVRIQSRPEEKAVDLKIAFSRTPKKESWESVFAEKYRLNVIDFNNQGITCKSESTAFVIVFDKQMETSSSSAALNFSHLQEVLRVVNSNNSNVPILIITENTQKRVSSKTISLAGSELWGVARTLRWEHPHLDIRLIDVDTGDLDFDTIFSVLKMRSARNAELIISGKFIEHVVLMQTQRTFEREIEPDLNSNAILKSSTYGDIRSLYMIDDDTEAHAPNAPYDKIRISKFFSFDRNILKPTSAVGSHRIWPESDNGGSSVLILEGCGFSKSKGSQVGFLFPVVARFPYVNVPLSCTWSLSEYPSLEGLMTCYVFFQKCMEYVNQEEIVAMIGNVSALSDDDKNAIQALFSEKRCTVKFYLMDEFCSSTVSEKQINVILFGDISASEISQIKLKKPSPKQILGLNGSTSTSVQTELNISVIGVKMSFISLSDLYNENTLCKLIPMITRKLKGFSTFESCRAYCLFESVLHERETHDLTISHIRHVVTKDGLFRKSGCYIIVGGLTGLGLLLVEHFSAMGAGHIAILARRIPNESQRSVLNDLESRTNCKIYTFQVDICNKQKLMQTKNELLQLVGKDVSIRGVFQGAGILHDAVFENQTAETITKVMAPKLEGTLNLHECFKEIHLDFFVMHSSVASLLGNPGQTNYAAANSFLDSFAAYRRSIGMSGQSINWGALKVGMTNDHAVQQKLARRGIHMMENERILRYIVYALESNQVTVCFADLNWELLSKSLGSQTVKYRGFVTQSRDESHKTKVGSTPTDLARITIQNKRLAVKQVVERIISDQLITDLSEHDETESLSKLGIDSLSASGIANKIYEHLKVRIPLVKLLAGTTSIAEIIDLCCSLINPNASEHNKGSAFIDENIAFTQIPDLDIYKNTPNEPGLMFLVDILISGPETTNEQFYEFVCFLVSKFPELRSTISLKDNLVHVVDMESFRPQSVVNHVNYDDLYKNVQLHIDQRHQFSFDLENEYPIKFVLGRNQRNTIVRMAVHKTVSDLRSLKLIFTEMFRYFAEGNKFDPSEFKDVRAHARHDINTLPMQNRDQTLMYWSSKMKDAQVTSISRKGLHLDKNKFASVREDIDEDLIQEILQYIDRRQSTLYQFFSTTYSLLLYIETGNNQVTYVTDADLSRLVSGIESDVVRGINIIPCIVTVDPKLTLEQFGDVAKRNLIESLDHITLPFQDITAMAPEDIRPHIGRHHLIMNDTKEFGILLKSEDMTVEMGNMWAVWHNKETICQIVHDLSKKQLSVVMHYNSACTDSSILNKMLRIVRRIVRYEDQVVESLTSESTTLQQSVSNVVMNGNVSARSSSTVVIDNEIESSKSLNTKVRADDLIRNQNSHLQEIARGLYCIFVHLYLNV